MNWLVVWNLWIIFPLVGNRIPSDVHISSEGWLSPTNQLENFVALTWFDSKTGEKIAKMFFFLAC